MSCKLIWNGLVSLMVKQGYKSESVVLHDSFYLLKMKYISFLTACQGVAQCMPHISSGFAELVHVLGLYFMTLILIFTWLTCLVYDISIFWMQNLITVETKQYTLRNGPLMIWEGASGKEFALNFFFLGE